MQANEYNAVATEVSRRPQRVQQQQRYAQPAQYGVPLTQDEAALLIQRHYRGFRDRKHFAHATGRALQPRAPAGRHAGGRVSPREVGGCACWERSVGAHSR